MLYLLIPTSFETLVASMSGLATLQIETDGNMFLFGYNVFITAIETIFTFEVFDFKVVAFFIICLCIALHMNLSSADIKGSLGAIPLIIVLLIIVNVIMYFVGGSAYTGFLEGVSVASAYLIAVLSLSLVFAGVILVLGLIIRLFKKLIFKR